MPERYEGISAGGESNLALGLPQDFELREI